MYNSSSLDFLNGPEHKSEISLFQNTIIVRRPILTLKTPINFYFAYRKRLQGAYFSYWLHLFAGRPSACMCMSFILTSLNVIISNFIMNFLGKRRYDRKQAGYGGQTKPIFHKKV